MTIQAHDTVSLAEDLALPSRETTSTASVTKALMLLDVFRNDGPVLGVTEISRRAGLAKSTAFRLLVLLDEAGLVERVGRGYQLSWRLFELGASVHRRWANGLRDVAAPWLTDTHVRSGGLVVHLGVLDGPDVLIVERVSGPRSPRVPTEVGARLPANCTALGKALLAASRPAEVRAVLEEGLVRRTPYSTVAHGRMLAELRRVAETGVAVDGEELALGLNCVASPVTAAGSLTAALSISGPTHNWDAVNNSHLVRKAAQQISFGLARNTAGRVSY